MCPHETLPERETYWKRTNSDFEGYFVGSAAAYVDYLAGSGSVYCSDAVAGSDCSNPETSMDHYCSEPSHTGR